MKKWLLAVAMAVGVSALFVDVPGHKLEASAKYKTYISKTYRDGDGNSNPTGFFAGNFKKTLPSGLVVKNSSKDRWEAILSISKGPNVFYVDTDIFMMVDDRLAFTSSSTGYLNMAYLTANRGGEVYCTLVTVSPSGNKVRTLHKMYKGGIKSVKFTTPDKLKIVPHTGKVKVYRFSKGNIK